MLDEVFAEAVIHAPVPWWLRLGSSLATRHSPLTKWSAHSVLGLRLRPFSFWHAFNLDLVQHNADKLTNFAALLLAARCCQLRYPKSLADARHSSLVTNLVTLRFKHRFDRDLKFKAAQIQRFIAYRKDYADCVPEIEQSGEAVKLPWYLYQVAMLRRVRPELTEAQAWDAPIAASQWQILAHLAANGTKIDIITPEDRRDLAEAEKEAGPKIIDLKSAI